MSFEDLKRQSNSEYLNYLKGHLRFDIGKHKSTKLRKSLGALSKRTLLAKSVSETHANRLEKQFNSRWSTLTDDEALDRLRFWTVLDSLVYLDEDGIRESIMAMKYRLEGVCEKVRGIEVIGVCEIEVLNLDKMRFLAEYADEARKYTTVIDMIPKEERSLFKKNISSYVLVHFHGIVDLMSFADKTERILLEAAKKEWNGQYRVELKKLFSTRSMRSNFHHIAKYLVKGGNENLMYKIGYGYDTEDAMNRHLIKTGKATMDADFDGFENEMSLTVKEIEVLGKSIHDLMNSTGSSMRNGYLFKYGYQKRW